MLQSRHCSWTFSPALFTRMNLETPFQLQLTQPPSLIGKCLTHVKTAQRKAEQFLVPIIEERNRLPPEERPNDMLTWLMEDAIGEEKDPRNLTLRVLVVNFAAIHTTSRVSYPHLTSYAARI